MRSRLTTAHFLPRLAQLALAVGLCAPASAWATCGDYLHPHLPQEGQDLVAWVASSPASLPALPVRGCSGPECRRAPHAPPAHAPAVAPRVHFESAILMADASDKAHRTAKVAPAPAP